MILGIDLSTSISGYSVIDEDGNLVLNDDVDTRREKNINKVADENAEFIDQIVDDFDIEYIFIEENLKSFSSGFSSASILSKLSKINGIVCWHCWSEHKMEPELIPSSTARKKAGLTMNKKKREAMKKRLIKEGKSKSYAKGHRTKMVVHEFVQQTEPNFTFERTRSDNPRPASYDRADSVIIARAGEQKIKSKNKK